MTDSPSQDGSEFVYLSDLSPNDKPWDLHKIQSRKVSDLYGQASFDRYSKRVWECSQSLEFALKRDSEGTIKLKLHSTRFCRVRWCPVCLWRRAMMWRARFIKAMPLILADHPRSRFIFLTLTVKNCPLGNLRATVAQMNKAWIRITQRKGFPATGWLKTIEVTRGQDDSAHPHFHCLLMVNEGYFKRGYISQAKWTELWKDCLRIDYTPIVNIKTVKNRRQTVDKLVDNSVDINVDNVDKIRFDDMMAGVLETIKYSVKPADLVADLDDNKIKNTNGQNNDRQLNWLAELTKQLHKTRAIGLGGLFRDYLSEDEPKDLIHTELEEETDLTDEDKTLIFDWAEIVRKYSRKNL